MSDWKDYYKILQVHHLAEPEVIKAVYKKLAQKYHPDTHPDFDAENRMKELNTAYEVLSNPGKRKEYDLEWHRRVSIIDTQEKVQKPKPVVDPSYINFDNVRPGKLQTASFIIQNNGGPCSKIWFSDPKSWMRIRNYSSLTDSDELPLYVEIEAKGEEWDESYSEVIVVRLDDEETQVRVELRTMPKPVPPPHRKPVPPSHRSSYQTGSVPTQTTRGNGFQIWLLVVAAMLGISLTLSFVLISVPVFVRIVLLIAIIATVIFL